MDLACLLPATVNATAGDKKLDKTTLGIVPPTGPRNRAVSFLGRNEIPWWMEPGPVHASHPLALYPHSAAEIRCPGQLQLAAPAPAREVACKSEHARQHTSTCR